MPEFIPVIKKHEIQRQILRVAETISTDYQGRELVLIGVLKGAFLFLADLARELKLETVKIDFLQASSYGADIVSSETIVLKKDIDVDIRGKDVLVVEDIVDTGLTLQYLLKNLEARGPESLHTVALLSKPSRRKIEVPLEYVGFEIPDEFVVGYGLDFDQCYRNLPDIRVLSR